LLTEVETVVHEWGGVSRQGRVLREAADAPRRDVSGRGGQQGEETNQHSWPHAVSKRTQGDTSNRSFKV
jgi:hypothetical protein